MRKINLLWMILIGTPSLSFTSQPNKSVFTISRFNIVMSEDKKSLQLITKYSSTIESSDLYVDISWYVQKDNNPETYIKYTRIRSIKAISDVECSVKPEVDISTLGEDNIFKLYVTPSDTKVKETINLHFNLKGKSKVTFSESDNNKGVSSGYIIENYVGDNTSTAIEDRITFTNYEDLVVEENYLNFDIKRFNYFYTGNDNKTTLEGNFYFCIYDKYNVFKDLPIYKDSQYRYIELTPLVINNNSTFGFKNNIYYDPETHNPSISQKEGYLETDKLYFPIGELEKLKSIHCLLSFDINGFTNFNMSSEFDIYFLKNYFGDCSNSEYCVEINNDDGTNIREKIVEVDL